MKKKYQTPTTKVVKVQQAQIICASQMLGSQNEQYVFGSTEGWF